jgi:hypothetical protein
VAVDLTLPLGLNPLKFVLAQAEDQSMKRKRFTEEQIIGILKEHEAGVPVADLCRKDGVSDASIYKWKARFGGMDVVSDNGSELTSNAILVWADQSRVEWHYITSRRANPCRTPSSRASTAGCGMSC